MKNLILSIFCTIGGIAAFLPAFSQAPQGRLFIHTSRTLLDPEGELGYIHYPTGVYHKLDSVQIKDMEISGNSLITIGRNMYRYDLATGQKTDSLTNIFGKNLEIWNDRFVTIHDSLPYFRVYRTDFSLDFVIDTPAVKPWSMDLFVAGNEAIIAYADSIVGVNLQTKNLFPFQHNDPVSPLAGTYRNIYAANGTLYANFDWFTGVPRVTIVEIDTLVDSLRFVAKDIFWASYFAPVPAGEKVYMGWHLGYYDFALDTFVLSASATQDIFAIEWDDLTASLFVMEFLFSSFETSVSYLQGDSISPAVTAPGYVNLARFYTGNNTAIDPTITASFRLFPNPSTGWLTIFTEKPYPEPVEVTIFDLTGQKLLSQKGVRGEIEVKIDLTGYAEAVYLVAIRSGNTFFSQKIIFRH